MDDDQQLAMVRNTRPWRKGNEVGRIYRLSAADLNQVGNCPMRGRLFVGDIVLCIRHSGDCFFYYILLSVGHNFVKGVPGLEFGSYCFATKPFSWKPTKAECKLLCAGKYLCVSPSKQHPLAFEISNPQTT